ncbi:MAG: hypothetical protein WDN04_27495 [Rhodospirillales bacterium]
MVDLASPPEVGSIRYGKNKVYHPPGEVGPGVLRPDGTVFATGGTTKGANAGHTAIYTPPAGGTGIGTWAAGPDFPAGEDAGDSFAALLPTGNVLVESEIGRLYEFNGQYADSNEIRRPRRQPAGAADRRGAGGGQFCLSGGGHREPGLGANHPEGADDPQPRHQLRDQRPPVQWHVAGRVVR